MQIKRRDGTVAWEGEAKSKREAVEMAVECGADLRKANLSGANLSGADLSKANLSGADLRWADLGGADLIGAELRSADLRGANLCRANLRGVNLRWANLCKADLRGADLRTANLRAADLYKADLSRADLRGANLTGVRLRNTNLGGAKLNHIMDDLYKVLAAAKSEVPGLMRALREGRVEGSAYEGECACLVGTLANVRGCKYTELPGVRPNADRPAEQWFINIGRGDTPANSQVSKITVEWVKEWMKRRGIHA